MKDKPYRSMFEIEFNKMKNHYMILVGNYIIDSVCLAKKHKIVQPWKSLLPQYSEGDTITRVAKYNSGGQIKYFSSGEGGWN